MRYPLRIAQAGASGRFQGLARALVEVFRELERAPATLVHVPLHSPLIAAQGLTAGAIAQVAGLDVEQDLDLPRTERVAADVAAQQLLDQLVELREYSLGIELFRPADLQHT